MAASDVVGSIVALSFGLWLVLFPRSVVRFYTWFHRGKVRLPGILVMRLIGAGWIALVLGVLWDVFAR